MHLNRKGRQVHVMTSVKDLKIKIFSDGAELDQMRQMYKGGIVRGFTTNPSLMKKAGVNDYEAFAKQVLAEITNMDISFEVFSDEFDQMEREARKIHSWGKNLYIKIPVTNTKGMFSTPLIKKLSGEGFRLNVTAILTIEQVRQVTDALAGNVDSIISVFAGRIADTGSDPEPMMRECLKIMKPKPKAELLWASCRETLNIFQAERCGCHIITVPPSILSKLNLVGTDLTEYSLDTVKMFYKDAIAAGFKI